ncbi:MAG: alpha/beta hydrolase [Betaproteobacteria bacterium]|nr:alpha/beta hydrolase [Betaproteobacteria bacterium]
MTRVRNGSLAWLAVLLVAMLLAGCANLWRLSVDTRETRERVRLLEGNLQAPSCSDCPVIVIVLGDESPPAIHNFRVFEGSGSFRVAALRESRRLFAFQDVNRDFSYQAGEPAVWLDLASLRFAGVTAGDIELVLGALQQPAPPGLTNLFELRGSTLGSIDVQMSEIVTLDDERFSRAAAESGIWEPIAFMKRGYAGIFFLEPYDPGRVPVLFIPGINGSPRDFARMIAALDRKRFQAWVMHYPSGLDLRAMGDGLVGLMAELQLRHDFRALHVVAHSMGGLVGREFLAECARSDGCNYMRRFISISTPFSGEASAGLGVAYAPVVVPVWRNLTPGSPFLAHLFDQALPPGVEHHLLFSFRNESRLRPGSGDGVILLDSQLRTEAQVQAASLRGFNDDHMSILDNADVHCLVNSLLAAGNSDRRDRASSASRQDAGDNRPVDPLIGK